jgi:hypothetical protein
MAKLFNTEEAEQSIAYARFYASRVGSGESAVSKNDLELALNHIADALYFIVDSLAVIEADTCK